jgi:hypothetical protein
VLRAYHGGELLLERPYTHAHRDVLLEERLERAAHLFGSVQGHRQGALVRRQTRKKLEVLLNEIVDRDSNGLSALCGFGNV